MTVPVGLDQLRFEAAKYGDAPYLLTVSDDGRPHAVSVRVGWREDQLTLSGGSRSRANAAKRPDVTLLWPAIEEGGYSLIADGAAAVEDEQILIRPLSAVLHRSLAASQEHEAGSECVPVLTAVPPPTTAAAASGKPSQRAEAST
jgi:hypothetical protein